MYINPLLLQLEDRYSGIKIGSISILHITVVDDLVILGENKSDSQMLVEELTCVFPPFPRRSALKYHANSNQIVNASSL